MKHFLLTTIAAVVLLGCGNSEPDISIQDAAYEGNIEVIKQHLAAGKDANAKTDWGSTLLHEAALRGHKEVVELLITKDADVNTKDSNGGTPLNRAAAEGHKEIVELLIAKGADVNVKDKDGTTPLDMADDKETANLLRKHGGKTGEELQAEGK